MKYRLTEDWLEYKKGEIIECDRYTPANSALTFRYNLESRTSVTSVSATELSLLLKTGILEEVREEDCGLLRVSFYNAGRDLTEILSSTSMCESEALEASEKIKALLLSLKK